MQMLQTNRPLVSCHAEALWISVHLTIALTTFAIAAVDKVRVYLVTRSSRTLTLLNHSLIHCSDAQQMTGPVV